MTGERSRRSFSSRLDRGRAKRESAHCRSEGGRTQGRRPSFDRADLHRRLLTIAPITRSKTTAAPAGAHATGSPLTARLAIAATDHCAPAVRAAGASAIAAVGAGGDAEKFLVAAAVGTARGTGAARESGQPAALAGERRAADRLAVTAAAEAIPVAVESGQAAGLTQAAASGARPPLANAAALGAGGALGHAPGVVSPGLEHAAAAAGAGFVGAAGSPRRPARRAAVPFTHGARDTRRLLGATPVPEGTARVAESVVTEVPRSAFAARVRAAVLPGRPATGAPALAAVAAVDAGAGAGRHAFALVAARGPAAPEPGATRLPNAAAGGAGAVVVAGAGQAGVADCAPAARLSGAPAGDAGLLVGAQRARGSANPDRAARLSRAAAGPDGSLAAAVPARAAHQRACTPLAMAASRVATAPRCAEVLRAAGLAGGTATGRAVRESAAVGRAGRIGAGVGSRRGVARGKVSGRKIGGNVRAAGIPRPRRGFDAPGVPPRGESPPGAGKGDEQREPSSNVPAHATHTATNIYMPAPAGGDKQCFNPRMFALIS